MTSFGKHYFLAKSSRHVQNNEAHLLGPKTAIIFLGVVMGKVLHFFQVLFCSLERSSTYQFSRWVNYFYDHLLFQVNLGEFFSNGKYLPWKQSLCSTYKSPKWNLIFWLIGNYMLRITNEGQINDTFNKRWFLLH